MSYNEYLRHVLDEAKYIAGKSKGLTRENFLKDERLPLF